MKVVIYGRPQCPYCERAIELCESKGLEFDYYTVHEHITVEELTEKAKQCDTSGEPDKILIRQVPQVFVIENDVERYIHGGYQGLYKELND